MDVQELDLDALDVSALEEDVEINPEANPMDAPAPPDDGTHRVKLLPLASGQVKVKETRGEKKTPFIPMKFSGVILAEGTRNNNKRIFGNVTTLVFDGKSEMAYIILKAKGATAEAKKYVAGLTNFGKLAQAFKSTLAAEPIIKVKTRWVAQRKITDANGDTKYENVLSGQKNFPKNPDGTYRHVVFDKVTQSEVTAQAQIEDYFVDAA